MLAGSLAAGALLAAHALLVAADTGHYQSELYEGPTPVRNDTKTKFFLQDGQCEGEIASTEYLKNCPRPVALRVIVYDYVPYADIQVQYDTYYINATAIQRKRDGDGYCKGKAKVDLYANCGAADIQPMSDQRRIQVPLKDTAYLSRK